MFAKIFDSQTMGQLLTKIDANDEGAPEVRLFFVPDGLGVCSLALTFSDDDLGWDKADKVFDKMDISFAENMAKPILDKIGTSCD